MEGHSIKQKAPDGVIKSKAVEDDVEGHSIKQKAPDGVIKSKATEDDVEGHVAKKKSPDGVAKKKAVDEDDVDGHVAKKKSPDGVAKKKAVDEDDVEGHMIGTMNPVLARDLARAKERDIQRAASRGNLISEAKRADSPQGLTAASPGIEHARRRGRAGGPPSVHVCGPHCDAQPRARSIRPSRSGQVVGGLSGSGRAGRMPQRRCGVASSSRDSTTRRWRAASNRCAAGATVATRRSSTRATPATRSTSSRAVR